MRAESAPELWLPRINNGHGDRTAQPWTAHRAPFSSPVCVPCGKWPKFIIACIWAPDPDGRRNSSLPMKCRPAKQRVRCVDSSVRCYCFGHASDDESRGLLFGAFRPNELRISSLPCTHSFCPQPAFTRHPSFNLLILLRLDGAHMRHGTGELPVLPQYAPAGARCCSRVCCLSSISQ